MTQKRIQRSRKKGWKMPSNAIYVGRPTKWGNPFVEGIDGTKEEVIQKYRKRLEILIKANPNFLQELEGKDLACWCPLDKQCHADILIEKLRSENK